MCLMNYRTILLVLSLFMGSSTRLWGQVPLDLDEPARRSLSFLRREVPRWNRENRCFSCHNNGDGARALFGSMNAKSSPNDLATGGNPGLSRSARAMGQERSRSRVQRQAARSLAVRRCARGGGYRRVDRRSRLAREGRRPPGERPGPGWILADRRGGGHRIAHDVWAAVGYGPGHRRLAPRWRIAFSRVHLEGRILVSVPAHPERPRCVVHPARGAGRCACRSREDRRSDRVTRSRSARGWRLGTLPSIVIGTVRFGPCSDSLAPCSGGPNRPRERPARPSLSHRQPEHRWDLARDDAASGRRKLCAADLYDGLGRDGVTRHSSQGIQGRWVAEIVIGTCTRRASFFARTGPFTSTSKARLRLFPARSSRSALISS